MQNASFEVFEKFWLGEIDKIENGVIDARGAQRVHISFVGDELNLKMSTPQLAFTWNLQQKLNFTRKVLTKFYIMIN